MKASRMIVRELPLWLIQTSRSLQKIHAHIREGMFLQLQFFTVYIFNIIITLFRKIYAKINVNIVFLTQHIFQHSADTEAWINSTWPVKKIDACKIKPCTFSPMMHKCHLAYQKHVTWTNEEDIILLSDMVRHAVKNMEPKLPFFKILHSRGVSANISLKLYTGEFIIHSNNHNFLQYLTDRSPKDKHDHWRHTLILHVHHYVQKAKDSPEKRWLLSLKPNTIEFTSRKKRNSFHPSD